METVLTEQELKSTIEELQRENGASETPQEDTELGKLVQQLGKMDTFKSYGYNCQVRWIEGLPEDLQMMLSIMAIANKEVISKMVNNLSAIIITTMLVGIRLGRKQVLGEMLDKSITKEDQSDGK